MLKMNKILTYCKDSYRELVEKVTWPTWAQLQQSTTIVLGATALITFLVWVMDAAISRILQAFYSII
jgi:preprotein translocase subunit SecE